MADITASELLAKTTIGSVYPCNTGEAHVWGAWEYNTLPSNMQGVEHSYQTRMCQQCFLVERLDLGFVAAKQAENTAPPATTTNGPRPGATIIPFKKG